ncbi:MAG: DUF1501 domain-containing protein [Myxococcales bacterium]|nr:DUF1501 domain-containing protein [Myxococcales bacterium]
MKHDDERLAEFTRRRFLRRAMAAGAGALSLGAIPGPLMDLGWAANKAAATSSPKVKDRYYIFCYFSGGWDTLLSLDPRDPVKFSKGKVAVTHIDPAYEQLNNPPNGGKPVKVKGAGGKIAEFGPYIGDLEKHFDKFSVVRGLSMDTLTHEVGRRRFLTGKPPSGLLARGSSGATWLAGLLGETEIIPNLAVRVESYNTSQPNFATGLKVNNVPDLLRSLKVDKAALSPKLEQLVNLTVAQSAGCGQAKASKMWQGAETSRQKARAMVNGGLDDLFAFQAKTPAMTALRNHYGIKAYGSAALQTPQAQAAMAVTAITAGISRVCSVQFPVLDAHFDDWATTHGPQQQAGFNTIARMLEDLQKRSYPGGGTWLDHTTIVAFSEFSRTPMINQRGGRDHSLTNACLVAGAGIKGGQVIGASADIALAPTKTNVSTGESDNSNGEIIKPEHIYRTLLHDIGITSDVADMRVPPITALLSKST